MDRSLNEDRMQLDRMQEEVILTLWVVPVAVGFVLQ